MNSKIKIVFFADILKEDFDGASRTIFQIIKRIPEDEFEFLFICGIAPPADFKYRYVAIPTIQIPFNKDYSMAMPFFHQRRLKKVLNDFNPHVLHISTPSMLGKFGMKYGKSKGLPMLTIYHTHFISYIKYYLERFPAIIRSVTKWVAKDQKKFYDNCDIIYIPTLHMVRELRSYGMSTQHMKIWSRGLNTEIFNPSRRNVESIHNYTGNNKKNVLFVSRLVWEKNLKTLVKIYNEAMSLDIPCNFIIAGDGVAKEEMLTLMPGAFFPGQLPHDELAKVYASCDVFLFTSVTETYGNVVAEAMASGLPCVIANGGGSAGFIKDGENGFLCTPESSHEYIDRIKDIMELEDVRLRFIREGLAFAEGLRWQTLTDTYFNDLKTLAERQSVEPQFKLSHAYQVAFG
ncbi:MAG: glycosyltransferase [Saprospiraceae bacterium]|nr:glycosyltransferase [Saprospiraceae bacterium]